MNDTQLNYLKTVMLSHLLLESNEQLRLTTQYKQNIKTQRKKLDLMLEDVVRAFELKEQGFEVTLAPEVTTGPARFRILGQRTISFNYAYTKDEQRILRGENWVEIDGTIYIVAVEAPGPNFRRFFERVRVAMNSMHHPD